MMILNDRIGQRIWNKMLLDEMFKGIQYESIIKEPVEMELEEIPLNGIIELNTRRYEKLAPIRLTLIHHIDPTTV